MPAGEQASYTELKKPAQGNLGLTPTVEARKLEQGFRRISARMPYTLP